MTGRSGTADSWITKLDQLATDCEFPMWDNLNLTCGAMRATGFLAPQGWALAFELITYSRGEPSIQRDVYAYGPALQSQGLRASTTCLVPTEELVEYPDERTIRSRLTGRIIWWEGGGAAGTGEAHAYWPVKAIPKTATIRVLGEPVTVPLKLPSLGGRKLKPGGLRQRALPEEAVMFQLCEQLPRETLFASPAELAASLGLAEATVHFQLQDWQHPGSGKAASTSPDIVEMVEALEQRRALGTLSGRANCDWRQWLDTLLPLWSESDADEWRITKGGPPPATPAPEPKPLPAPAWLETTNHPQLDAGDVAVRASGFVSSLGPLLVLQGVGLATCSISREIWAYGPGTPVGRRLYSWPMPPWTAWHNNAPEEGLSPAHVKVGPATYLVLYDQLYEAVAKKGKVHKLRCRFKRGERITLDVLGHPVTLTLEVPPTDDLELEYRHNLRRLIPSLVLLYALCDAAPRDVLFASSTELRRLLSLPDDARLLFEFDDFQTVRSGQPLNFSPDLAALANALVDGAPLTRLPGRPDANWRHWLDHKLGNLLPWQAAEWDKPFLLQVEP
jgi:hypothetical protein